MCHSIAVLNHQSAAMRTNPTRTIWVNVNGARICQVHDKRLRLSLAALALTGLLGGCVAYPAYPSYGYGYGYGPAGTPATAYLSSPVAVAGAGAAAGGMGGHDGWHR